MVKRLIGLVMLLMCIFTMGAQQLPLNPKVRHGQLPNGLNYYVLHNEEPKGRANFYIAQKVGSTLETPEQLGLAHFLEHMAFNGTKNYPGHNMLEYLQHKGIRFGADINAYTGFDETVYNINNVPTSDLPLMDSVLLVLRDWSCDLLLEDAEIDSERGVIQGEYRQRNDADTRMYTQILPQIFEEYQYHQMPIGTMDVVMNFPYQALRDYYQKWYRPDQQGIVVVGDFDAEAMEKKIIEMFSSIKMPENAAPRTYPMVSDNKDLIYATYEDPELKGTMVRFSVKMDKTPFEQRNTVEYYVGDVILENLIQSMMNARLDELKQKADCSFVDASFFFSDFWVSKTKDSMNLFILAKNDPKVAFNEAYSEVVRSLRTGFTDSELARAKEQFKSGLERLYNERDKTDSNALGKELIRTFVDNEPTPGIENEWALTQNILPMINAAMINQMLPSMLKDDNQVMVVTQPKADGKVLPTKEEMQVIISNVQSAEYEAYVDNVLDEPLIAKMPKKGSIKATKEIPALGATELTLSNGAHVYVKTTDFASDQILFSAVAPFGKFAMGQDQASDAKIIPLASEVSKLGNFDNNQLMKALAGKNIASSYTLDGYSSGLVGSSSIKDLETLMQIIYLQFTNMQPDDNMYAATVDQYRAALANNEKNPEYIFTKAYTNSMYGGNLLTAQLGVEDFDKADYKRMLDIVKGNLQNAADYDFIFVGNVDVATLKPLLEQYIASLPGNAKKLSKQKNVPVKYAAGTVDNKFETPVESDIVKELVLISGENLKYNLDNSAKLSLMGDILDMIYTRSLREELGGTYGAYATANINPRTNQWMLLYLYDTNDGQRQQLDDRAVADLNDLMSKGATPEDFNKVKEAALTQAALNAKKNNYWLDQIRQYCTLGFESTAYRNALEKLTLDDLNKFMKALYDGKNRIHVTMDGVVVKK